MGLLPLGVISIGLFSLGLISAGVFSTGLLAFGTIALGLVGQKRFFKSIYNEKHIHRRRLMCFLLILAQLSIWTATGG